MFKKIMAYTVEFKTIMSLFFSGGIIIYVVFGYMLGTREISFEMIVQIFFISILVTGLHYLFWTEDTKVKLTNSWKLILQYFILGFVLIGMSQVFNWFEWGSKTSYMMLILFHILYLGGILGFTIYFKVLGFQFNQKMQHYREQNQLR
ncbi:hypothetical protein ABE65_001790 [Fictibacillus phosphorivorans]|uniref:DUF3021 domain-containing protein n=1 Tax=Fictibacillus phosphorivorans TaxID=1221500 RepID=A0A168VR61_9BACL|nr:hypothetical protein [Fictibacillus phosphorivorans]ANC75639.1 hypothetical protein ABE65_001790 [Fictibacillus phosphorivorans]